MPLNKAPAIAADIRRRLEAEEWRTGAQLGDERSFAKEYDVARNTIRKAFSELEREGLINRQVGRGTIVSEKPGEQYLPILDRFLDASPLDILNLRIYIEPQTAAEAARNASERELAHIVDADRRASQAEDLLTYDHWDNEFHRLIYAAARNEFLSEFFAMLAIIRHQAPMMEIRRRSFTQERRLIYGGEHAAIVAALKAWDGEAAANAMRTHLLTRRTNYFGHQSG